MKIKATVALKYYKQIEYEIPDDLKRQDYKRINEIKDDILGQAGEEFYFDHHYGGEVEIEDIVGEDERPIYNLL